MGQAPEETQVRRPALERKVQRIGGRKIKTMNLQTDIQTDIQTGERPADSLQRCVRRQILHLTLHKKWFDAIARGEKLEEYRAQSPHWKTRLENRQYDEIHFRNGYAKDAPFMRVECNGMTLGEWDGQSCFVLKLGKILELKNHEENKTATDSGKKPADAQA